VACLYEEDVVEPTREIFGNDGEHDTVLPSPRRCRVSIVGASLIGAHLAEFLTSKPGSVQLGVCDLGYLASVGPHVCCLPVCPAVSGSRLVRNC
jgi:hypothetical protein